MEIALLKELTREFSSNRPAVSRTIRRLYASNPSEFVKAAAHILRESEESAGSRYLLSMLLLRPDYLQILCDPNTFAPFQSAALLRRARTLDRRVEWKLAKLLAGLDYNSEGPASFATHCLEVLIQLSEDATVLPALRGLLHCSSARVRSKVALLIGHISRNPQWAKHEDVHLDGRVTDNAVESVWGLDSSAAKEAFREAAATSRHRAAANGAVGLYLAREKEAIGLLFRFSRHEQRTFRAAAAWAMARTGDPRFLPALKLLESDPEKGVRSTASRAFEALQIRLSQLRGAGSLAVQIRSAKFHDGGHTLHVVVDDGNPALKLNALNFAILNGHEPVEEFTLAKISSDGKPVYELHFRGHQASSRMVTIQIFMERGCGEDTGFEIAYASDNVGDSRAELP